MPINKCAHIEKIFLAARVKQGTFFNLEVKRSRHGIGMEPRRSFIPFQSLELKGKLAGDDCSCRGKKLNKCIAVLVTKKFFTIYVYTYTMENMKRIFLG